MDWPGVECRTEAFADAYILRHMDRLTMSKKLYARSFSMSAATASGAVKGEYRWKTVPVLSMRNLQHNQIPPGCRSNLHVDALLKVPLDILALRTRLLVLQVDVDLQ